MWCIRSYCQFLILTPQTTCLSWLEGHLSRWQALYSSHWSTTAFSSRFSPVTISIQHMCGSRKFIQGRSNFDNAFLVDEWIQIPLKSGHHWPASETPFNWHHLIGICTCNSQLFNLNEIYLLSKLVRFWSLSHIHMGESSKFPKSRTLETKNFKPAGCLQKWIISCLNVYCVKII